MRCKRSLARKRGESAATSQSTTQEMPLTAGSPLQTPSPRTARCRSRGVGCRQVSTTNTSIYTQRQRRHGTPGQAGALTTPAAADPYHNGRRPPAQRRRARAGNTPVAPPVADHQHVIQVPTANPPRHRAYTRNRHKTQNLSPRGRGHLASPKKRKRSEESQYTRLPRRRGHPYASPRDD